jgi:hypothetical protein
MYKSRTPLEKGAGLMQATCGRAAECNCDSNGMKQSPLGNSNTPSEATVALNTSDASCGRGISLRKKVQRDYSGRTTSPWS